MKDSQRRVADIMTRRVVTVRPHESVARVRRLMLKGRIHALPVVNGQGRLVGMVTLDDLAAHLPRQERETVRAFMRRTAFILPPDASLSRLARLMHRHRIQHVLVCEREGEVAGIVSAFDLLRLIRPRSRPRSHAPRRAAPPPLPMRRTRGPLTEESTRLVLLDASPLSATGPRGVTRV